MTGTPASFTVLDSRQLERIQSVHRGFLYQHLYAAACLLRAGSSARAILWPRRPTSTDHHSASLEIGKKITIVVIPRSRHNPKILGVDDAEIVGDRITELRPIPRNFFTQETERRIGELGASCVALVVRDMLVHHAP